LRRSRKFEEAEKCYKEAISTSAEDEYLLFNLGRIYIDWKQEEKVEKTALRALGINPDFIKAQKMLRFSKKHLE